MQENITDFSDRDYPVRILRIAGEAAKMTIQYGGGASRAEEIYCRICRACGMYDVQISAVSTTVSATLTENGQSYTTVFRVPRRGVNLTKLNMVNDISRGLANDRIDLEAAQKKLTEIDRAPGNKELVTVMAAGFSSAFFSLLLGGKLWDFVITLLIGAFISFVLSFFEKAGSYNFINNLFGGILDAGIAILISIVAANYGIHTELEAVIVGAMMPLLPGLATTNAIRDTISGDYISGTASVMEALSMAIALAAGAALSFGIFMSLGVKVW